MSDAIKQDIQPYAAKAITQEENEAVKKTPYTGMKAEQPPFIPWAVRFGLVPEPVIEEEKPEPEPEKGAQEQEISEEKVEEEPQQIVPPPIDIEALKKDAYNSGFEQGRSSVLAEMREERQAVGQLARGLEVLKAEPPRALASVLADVVDRLVHQVIGEVSIDAVRLRKRVDAVAAMITEEAKPCFMFLNPADIERLGGVSLPVELKPDPSLPEGSVRLETNNGWIENGTKSLLEKLDAALVEVGAEA
ncbi:MAG: hypothetical protein ABF461_01470 [Zymomonas mobilis subsp. pomaceae]|uniref:Flagellar assembly protein FliH n=1 Tax=Zymomonas mobilis subsp. pomaceae (strain ATCC 29192 / DSM 22645 / JCM 10191 / CCUG 17912 / NBRC 13757 / NCIMB 11200 / NRRL B-4491 / Barker I) TaxID=579138 RepID=F8ERN5_ZYMMT|nr:hypothetical protein [Zymomonas mobilis]AEI37493.1 hypothetical protein Zymop_0591 [Zymomonas mobilis subsp. pomaceae ATCC 29192]MDX5948861.1 hypothetical protein [Zymomonas mobilis subsp. pomaceae]GEB88668.1 hypothetical protein ZMO02_03050 [Zymomonas mobilis subsp. pomaceae]